MNLPTQYFDTPYFYAKNYINNLVWAAGHPPVPLNVNDVVQSDGDTEFHMRRYQMNTGSGGVVQYQLYNAAQQQFTSLPQGFSVNVPGPANISRNPIIDTPMVPPYIYPRGCGIPHAFFVQDMLSLGLAMAFPDVDGVHTDLVHILPIVYQGVKRWWGKPDYSSDYKYYYKPWTYVFTFDLNWLYLNPPFNGSFNVAPPHTFYIEIPNFDFELMRVEASWNPDHEASPAGSGYMAQIYDANGIALMNTFVQLPDTISSIGSNIGFGPSTNNWPNPPVVYPKGGQIRIDILSLADSSGGTGPTTINFKGVQRIPC